MADSPKLLFFNHDWLGTVRSIHEVIMQLDTLSSGHEKTLEVVAAMEFLFSISDPPDVV